MTAPINWISKWVDYTDKYGIGYQLSDNSVGVLLSRFEVTRFVSTAGISTKFEVFASQMF